MKFFKNNPFISSIILIIFCAFLFFFVYTKGVSLLKDGVEKVSEQDFFASYASLFGALITVFVALFSLQKWWDRSEFDEIKNQLKNTEDENKKFQNHMTEELEKRILPDTVNKYVEDHKGEISQSLRDMFVDNYVFNSTILHVDFFESIFYSQNAYLKEEEKCTFSRVIFSMIVEKIKNHANKYGIFERAIDLLSDISEVLLSPELIINNDKKFYKNLEYLHHEILVVKYDAELSNIFEAHEEKAAILEENVKTLYGRYISRPSDSLACNKKYGLDNV